MIEMNVNGTVHRLDVEDDTPLLWVLREQLGLTGTKYGCGVAQCGACTVLVDGEAMRSCSLPAEAAAGRTITTIEAIEDHPVGRRVVEAWVEAQAPQCGYCQSGQVMAATALLAATPKPTPEEVGAAMTNICRCGTYNAIARAIGLAAERA
ncbi:(2Fe-2S)-binding protein [Roseomonas eburnea]|uniref:(2Fe-2S)-binding protein n=1 Tax=Neoroseomonas eburnea TaxID=1346889 RepID=A0A9X9XD19_9PROT|nr:(2Fe-2S)-binding protein [Neoroseomonas eburnea]MBR0681605.1 (2Fe-2S)-binding protein [Neoroseomonas eburnea]